MAMGKRKRQQQQSLWVETDCLARGPGHPFYVRLNHLLDEVGFDAFVEGQCARYYAVRPRLVPSFASFLDLAC